MFRTAAALCLLLGPPLVLAACGQAPMGAPAEASSPPADAPASTPPGPDFSGEFYLIGTEPFWGGRIRADRLIFSRAGQPDITSTNTGVQTEGDVGSWGTGRMVFKLRPEPCSDGMSDRRYDYRAEATINGELLKGCAATTAELAGQPRP
jgi:uncharacterized membrane protein